MAIVIASYNNEELVEQNLHHALRQNYDNYHIYYVNDCSSDDTGEAARAYAKELDKEHLITVIDNEERAGSHVHNQYNVIHNMLDDDTIVVILDGDDWLEGPNVLSYINAVYQNPDVWLTYGQCLGTVSMAKGISKLIEPQYIQDRAYRYHYIFFFHLRTFYSWLFKKIDPVDMQFNGEFVRYEGDVAFMLPMLEMAANGHYQFIDKILYIYNQGNPISDHKIAFGKQIATDLWVRLRPEYPTLDHNDPDVRAYYERNAPHLLNNKNEVDP